MSPVARAVPETDAVAVADVPDPAMSEAVASFTPAAVNATVPVGALVPLTGLTVAVRVAEAVELIFTGFAVTAVVVPTADCRLFHSAAMLYASTEPRPVARS